MAEADLAVRIVPSVGARPAAPYVPCALEAGHAHARLDTWAEALPWMLEALHGDRS